ncbi:exodeoxyribonuclease VII small subunit [Ornithinimicrobium flavum]|uniref:exodeoxyribonuclease VII small subunit n=1 Tax=Ornithinimicrobium flavum TaxID=1288636 RepID=UPI00106FD76A|nr:exodeoxyribonuclease VII small subunit [Ornithinimicrobium flavum]
MSTPDPADQDPTPVADLSYEQARDELVRLVSRIESGQVPLEEAMALWERGEQLAAHCQAKLDAAQDTLDRATGQGEQVTVGTGEGPGTPAGDEDGTRVGADDEARDDPDGPTA